MIQEQRQIIQNKGSDTLVNVAQAWAEAYQQVEPGVVVAVSGGGNDWSTSHDIGRLSELSNKAEVTVGDIVGLVIGSCASCPTGACTAHPRRRGSCRRSSTLPGTRCCRC